MQVAPARSRNYFRRIHASRHSSIKRLLVAILAVVVLTGACSSADDSAAEPDATVAPSPEPTATPQPTAAPQPEPTATPTPPPEPTATPEPEYQIAAEDDPTHLELGREVYMVICAGCHGLDGAGSVKGRGLIGIALEQPERQVHINSVSYGKGDMLGRVDSLTPQEIDAVVSYVRLTFLPPDDATRSSAAEVYDPAVLESGAAIFVTSCAECHGLDGAGTSTGSPLTGIAARQPDRAVTINTVANGSVFMPAWGDELSDDELIAVVDYVRSTF